MYWEHEVAKSLLEFFISINIINFTKLGVYLADVVSCAVSLG